MKKFFMLFSLLFLIKNVVVAQTQPYGTINKEDLELKACDFEKDANAEVLFEQGSVYFGTDLYTITEEIHKRIKIFNDNGKKEADIHIEYYSGDHLEYISGIQAETINLVDGKIERTKLDKKYIYNKSIDKERSEITFTFPNVQSGCVIEYKYKWNTNYFADFPSWYFQEKIPVRYSEFNTSIPDIFYFRVITHIQYPMVKETHSLDVQSVPNGTNTYQYNLENEQKAMADVHSLTYEPYMSSYADNVESLRFQLVSIKPTSSFVRTYSDTWAKIAGQLNEAPDFGGQFKKKLNNEQFIIDKAQSFKTGDDKIAYVFNEVKNSMKWDGYDDWRTNEGIYSAWEKKTGNSTEINLILYRLLKQSGVEAYPMVVSTNDHGKVDPNYTSLLQFNRTVVYLPRNNYVLDATGKYNIYNEIPIELLNSSGLYIDKDNNRYRVVYLKKDIPVSQVISIDAELTQDCKLSGSALIKSFSYYKIDAIEKYKTDGEKNYTEYLWNTDNNLKITSLRFEDMDVDTLPLIQKITFASDRAGSDDSYIYLNTNLFSGLKTNPFLSENRITDIDFGYCKSYSITDVYKIPNGFKIVSLPKSAAMDDIPDQSANFKRLVTEQNGVIKVQYSINFNKPELSYDYYPAYYTFFKKMYELLNEQIVLKKL